MSLTVFLYHDTNYLTSEFCKEFELNVLPKTFVKQIQWIKSNYNLISPKELSGEIVLPDRAALITFDDGFKAAFDFAIPYLEEQKIPSIMFLNMGHIIEKSPLVSSLAIFENSAKKLKVKNPHLDLTNEQYINMKNNEILKKNAQKYQGNLIEENVIEKFSNNKYLFYGNHLYYHWNANAISMNEFINNYNLNSKYLMKYKNHLNIFSFPNGQPRLTFENCHISALIELDCARAFYSSIGINGDTNKFLLNRIDLSQKENTILKIKLRLFLAKYENKLAKKLQALIRQF